MAAPGETYARSFPVGARMLLSLRIRRYCEEICEEKKKINEYLTLRSIQSVVGETTTNVYKTRHCAFQGYRRTSQGSGRRESARPGFPTITLSAP